jgi:hypothetical protein
LGVPQKLISTDPHPPGSALYVYGGGPNSLPFSAQTSPQDVVAAARALDAAQPALADFAARGFVRRLDLDRGSCWSNGAYAILAWERPGVPINTAQPIIVVNTAEGGSTYSTAVFGGMAAMTDSVTARFVADPNDPDDPAFAIAGVEVSTASTGGGGGGAPSKMPAETDAAGDPYHTAGATTDGGQPWMSAGDPKFGGLGSAPDRHYKFYLGHTPCYWEGLGAEIGFVAMAGLTGECPPVSITIGCLGLAFQQSLRDSGNFPGGVNCP